MRENTIEQTVAINFWNADQPLQRIADDRLSWRSVTTGGVAGVILALADPDRGVLEIETAQGSVSRRVEDIRLEPAICAFGGLDKRIAVYRLPDKPASRECSCVVPLAGLRTGDNPVHIRVTQEDGHMAWTSPVYVVR